MSYSIVKIEHVLFLVAPLGDIWSREIKNILEVGPNVFIINATLRILEIREGYVIILYNDMIGRTSQRGNATIQMYLLWPKARYHESCNWFLQLQTLAFEL